MVTNPLAAQSKSWFFPDHGDSQVAVVQTMMLTRYLNDENVEPIEVHPLNYDEMS